LPDGPALLPVLLCYSSVFECLFQRGTDMPVLLRYFVGFRLSPQLQMTLDPVLYFANLYCSILCLRKCCVGDNGACLKRRRGELSQTTQESTRHVHSTVFKLVGITNPRVPPPPIHVQDYASRSVEDPAEEGGAAEGGASHLASCTTRSGLSRRQPPGRTPSWSAAAA